jgi:hypothetical protein
MYSSNWCEMDNPLQTVITKYANSPAICQLVQNMNDYFSPEANIDQFYDQIWNIETAEGYGLDVWGRILGVGRVLAVAQGGPYLGFEEADDANMTPFGQGIFYAGSAVTQNYALQDDDYRTLLYAKAAANICDGSTPSINAILLLLFPGLGNCYVTDGNKTMTYTFTFALTPVQLAIVQESGVLPRPCGVSATVVQP